MVARKAPNKAQNGAKTVKDPTSPDYVEFADTDVSPGTGVVRQQRFDDDTLAAITSFDDAVALLASSGIDTFISAEDLGAGFALLKDKRQLVGIPFLIVEWSFHPGAAGAFVSCRVVTKDNRKLIVNDGGSGIFDQLKRISEKLDMLARPYRGVACTHGLRVSEYTYEDDDGEEQDAKTYYLDTSAS